MATNFHNVENNAIGYLDSALDSTSTSFTLDTDEGGNFPSTNFWVTIDDEILEVSIRIGDVFTVERGSQSTGASTHDSGASVELLETAEQITEIHTAINTLEDDVDNLQADSTAMEADIATLEDDVDNIISGATSLDALNVDGTSNIHDIVINGDITLDTTGCNKTWNYYVGAQEIQLHGDVDLSLNTFYGGDVYLATANLDQTAAEAISFSCGLPSDYQTGTELKLNIFWTATDGTAGDVYWNLISRIFADNENLATETSSGGSVTDTFLGLNYLHQCSIPFTPSNAGDGSLCTFYLRRLANLGGDTFNADAKLIGCKLEYS